MTQNNQRTASNQTLRFYHTNYRLTITSTLIRIINDREKQQQVIFQSANSLWLITTNRHTTEEEEEVYYLLHLYKNSLFITFVYMR